MTSRRSNRPSDEDPRFIEMVLGFFRFSTIRTPLTTEPLRPSFNNLEHYYESFPTLVLEESRASIVSGLDTNKKPFHLILTSPPKVYFERYKMKFEGSIPQEYECSPFMNFLLLHCQVKEKNETMLLLAFAHR